VFCFKYDKMDKAQKPGNSCPIQLSGSLRIEHNLLLLLLLLLLLFSYSHQVFVYQFVLHHTYTSKPSSNSTHYIFQTLVSVAARSNALICGCVRDGIAGSNLAGGMDICLLRAFVRCQVEVSA
jgi:hypothetical protein